MSKKDRQKILKRTISTKNFKIGALALIIGPILAFASINMNPVTTTEEGVHEWSELGEGKLVLLPSRLGMKNYTLFLRFDSDQNLTVNITIEDSEREVIDVIELRSDEEKKLNLTSDSLYLLIPPGTEYYGSSLEYNYTLTYYEQPYSILAFPALFSTIIGIYLVYSAQASMTYAYVEEKIPSEEAFDDENYKPPTLFGKFEGDDYEESKK